VRGVKGSAHNFGNTTQMLIGLLLEACNFHGGLDVHTLLRDALGDVNTWALVVSNGWQKSRRTYVFLRQLIHRFAELGTIGSPGWA
jgi:hypothetical protein